MAKMNATQRSYLVDQMVSAKNKALREWDRTNNNYKDTTRDRLEIIKKAIKDTGISLKHDSTYVVDYFVFPEDKNVEKLKKTREALESKLTAKLQEARDTIMLGDSEDAVAMLAKFRIEVAAMVKSK